MAIQQKTQIPEVQDTIVMLRQLSADEQIRMEAFYREKRLHDEASALGSARREGRAEGEAIGEARGRVKGEAIGRVKEREIIAENMRKSGFTEEQIKLALGDNCNG